MLKKILALMSALFVIAICIVTFIKESGGSVALATMLMLAMYFSLKKIGLVEEEDLSDKEALLVAIVKYGFVIIFSLMIFSAIEEGKLFAAIIIGFLIYFTLPKKNPLFSSKQEEIENTDHHKGKNLKDELLIDLEKDIKRMKMMYQNIEKAVNKSYDFVKEIEEKKNNAKTKMIDFEEKVKVALKDNQEEKARNLLKMKQKYEQIHNKYKEQFKHRKTIADKHKSKLINLQDEIEEAENMKIEYIAEKENVQITDKINSTLNIVEETNDENLEILKNRMTELKIKTEANDEIYNKLAHSSLEDKFEKLEENYSLDKELGRLKKKL
ncbi:PspA/IM30 family protein [Orenia marismortui]|uniref:Phage shock protein A (PspA) family protein n=1 Tax=Orenia marismortui TaxID=46469 RepID=A0A4R8HQ69_9FIRM|nr:PspA/IM30 family protein [Orenia marismortui]TDX58873.1 phage shock protein A (PspA) family protein [Orenia marismortui]